MDRQTDRQTEILARCDPFTAGVYYTTCINSDPVTMAPGSWHATSV